MRLAYQNCANVLGPVTVNLTQLQWLFHLDIEVKVCDSNDDGIEK
jgi:hypothetical protein